MMHLPVFSDKTKLVSYMVKLLIEVFLLFIVIYNVLDYTGIAVRKSARR